MGARERLAALSPVIAVEDDVVHPAAARPASLHVEGLVDGFRGDAHLNPARHIKGGDSASPATASR
jgi:hypothetical protein